MLCAQSLQKWTCFLCETPNPAGQRFLIQGQFVSPPPLGNQRPFFLATGGEFSQTPKSCFHWAVCGSNLSFPKEWAAGISASMNECLLHALNSSLPGGHQHMARICISFTSWAVPEPGSQLIPVIVRENPLCQSSGF